MPGPNRARAYLGLGGNLGDPQASMAAALRALDADPKVEVAAVSSLYRTPPWGKTDQPDFLNAVAAVDTDHEPQALLELCLGVERSLKRVRAERWGPRSIDIDILDFAGLTIDEEGLTLPHPRMLERAFVLAPLAEIAPDREFRGRSASEWLEAIDSSGMTVVGGPGWWRGAA